MAGSRLSAVGHREAVERAWAEKIHVPARLCAFSARCCALTCVSQEKIQVGDAFERVLNTLRRANVRSGVSRMGIRLERAGTHAQRTYAWRRTVGDGRLWMRGCGHLMERAATGERAPRVGWREGIEYGRETPQPAGKTTI